MAAGHGIVVDLKGFLTLFHAATDQAVTNAGSKAAHRCSLFQREDVDGLNIDRFQIRVALGDRHLRAQAREARLNAHPLEWARDAAPRHQTTVQRFVHGSYSFQRDERRSGVQGSAVWPQRDALVATAE